MSAAFSSTAGVPPQCQRLPPASSCPRRIATPPRPEQLESNATNLLYRTSRCQLVRPAFSGRQVRRQKPGGLSGLLRHIQGRCFGEIFGGSYLAMVYSSGDGCQPNFKPRIFLGPRLAVLKPCLPHEVGY